MTTDKHEELVKRGEKFLYKFVRGGEIDVPSYVEDEAYHLVTDLIAENARLKAAMEWREIRTVEDLPKRQGDGSYEQQDCLVIHGGDLKHLMWNCEHEVWDDASGDDFYCDALEPTKYLLIEYPTSTPPKEQTR